MLKTMTTKSLRGAGLTITYGWVAEDKEVWADGDKVTVKGEPRWVFEAKLDTVGEIDMPVLEAKATDLARELGINRNDTAVIAGTAIHNGKRVKIMVQIDDETYETIKAAKDAGAEVEEVGKVITHPGYCPRCGSYCYGDCEAN